MAGRSIRGRWAPLLAIIPALAGALPLASGARVGHAAGCTLTPTLQDFAVSQGVAAYKPLVRGKDTLVQLYFTLPSCANPGDIIKITGGALTSSLKPTSPYQMLTAPGFNLGLSSQALSTNSSLNPVFLVPGGDLRPADAGAFAVTFTASIQFSAVPAAPPSGGVVSTPGTSPVTVATTAASMPITGSYEIATNALRILVVPMLPNATSAFSSADTQAVEQGFAELSRLYPVPTGLDELTSTTAGIRRHWDSTAAINLSAVPNGANPPVSLLNLNGMYCGGSFGNILAPALDAIKQAWNSQNPNSPVDKVLGVVDEASSNGSGCPDGVAEYPTVNTSTGLMSPATSSYVRACYSLCANASGISITGALMAMEIAHTMGVVPAARQCATNKTHSCPAGGLADAVPTQQAGRTFNVAQRQYISDQHEAMDFVGDWANGNTLMETLNYGYLLCILGGKQNTECTQASPTNNGSVGQLSPAQTLYMATGVTDGTVSGTVVFDSFAAPSQQLQTPTDPASTVRLRETGQNPHEYGIDLTTTNDFHTGPSSGGSTSTAQGRFHIAVPFDPQDGGVQIVNTATTPATVLYSRDTSNGVPRAASIASAPSGAVDQPYVNDGNGPARPALSPDGRWLAWYESDGGGLVVRVAPVNNPAAAVRLTVNGDGTGAAVESLDPAWSNPQPGQPERLAFLGDSTAQKGALFTVTVDVSSGAPRFGTPQQVAAPSAAGRQTRRPTWSPDNSLIGYVDGNDSSGNIWDVNVASGLTTQLTNGGTDFEPSWSRSGKRLIAFARDSLVSTCSVAPCRDVWTVDPATPLVSVQSLVTHADMPAWGDIGYIAYRDDQDGNIHLVKDDGTGAPGPALTSAGNESSPSIAGTQFATEEPNRTDLAIGQVSFSTTVTGSTGSGLGQQNLRLDLYYSCPAQPGLTPVAAGIPGQAGVLSTSFTANLDTSGACGGQGTLTAILNDGLQQSAPVTTQLTVTRKTPTASISTPTPAQAYLQYGEIALNGSAIDAESGDVSSSGRWSLINATGTTVAQASGPSADLRAPAGGWSPGGYTVTFTATDSDGNTGTTATPITIAADADHDVIADRYESGSCFPAGHDQDPYESYRSYAGDGIPNADHTGDPCTAVTLYYVPALFWPNPLNVTSTKPYAAIGVKEVYRPLSQVIGATVRITTIDGIDVSTDPRFVSNKGWATYGPYGGALFDRQAINSVLVAHGLTNNLVTFTILGAAPTWSFTGTASTQTNTTSTDGGSTPAGFPESEMAND